MSSGERVMLRWLLCGVAIVGMGLEARAADLGDLFLRGSSTVISAPGGTRWDGFYVGGQVGMSVPGIDFANNTSSMEAVLSNAPVTGVTHVGARHPGFDQLAFRRLHRLSAAVGRRRGRRRGHLQLDEQVDHRDQPLSGGFGAPTPSPFRGRLRDRAHHRLRDAAPEGRLGGGQLLHAVCACRPRGRPHGHQPHRRRYAERDGAYAARHRVPAAFSISEISTISSATVMRRASASTSPDAEPVRARRIRIRAIPGLPGAECHICTMSASAPR